MIKKIAAEITQAVEILRAGGLVAMPTETVYGLGADASNEAAIRKIFAAKERPYDHPLIVHIAHLEQLSDWARDIPRAAIKLAQAFWPGPLTMILKKQPHVLDVVTGGQDTVGLRMPKHEVAQALLNAFGSGVAAPSANKFTHISPTTAAAVQEELGGRVDMILDGGACEVGLESTIIDLSQPQPVVLRPGMLSAAAIEAVLGAPVLMRRQDKPAEIRAPGMHHLHYAPVTQTILMDTQALELHLQSLTADDLPVAVVLHSEIALPLCHGVHVERLSANPQVYAHDIYHTLRTLDQKQFKRILIERVPDASAWDAIRDRLNKASAKK